VAIACLSAVVLLDGARAAAKHVLQPASLQSAWRRAADELALHRLESHHTDDFNRSRVVVVLGHKAQRDFPVYGFAFSVLGYRTVRSSALLLLGPELRSELYYLPSGGATQPVRLREVAAVLCHSVLAKNCFRGPSAWPSESPPTDAARVFTTLTPGQRINRLAAARPTLTTKDGFCAMLRLSGLALDQLHEFTFPCWSLPHQALELKAVALGNSEASGGGDSVSSVGAAASASGGGHGVVDSIRVGNMSTVGAGATPRRGRTWIVKPARGSEGVGIRVLCQAELLSLLDGCSATAGGGAGCGGSVQAGPAIVSPYLSAPLLRDGRKWDVRAYVLCTSVLPMRLYVFGEAIVRYASAEYASDPTSQAAALTNTAVGKRVLRRGVGAITGTLASLASHFVDGESTAHNADTLDGAGLEDFGLENADEGAEGWADDGDAETAFGGYPRLMGAMRRTIARLFLTAEPQLARAYAQESRRRIAQLRQPRGVARLDERLAGALASHRCSNCYHLFGVDLIADTAGAFRAIEVNVQPDLSLSRLGCSVAEPAGAGSSNAESEEQAAGGAANASERCAIGSSSYDDTKRAVAYNLVQIVYSRTSAAAELSRLLAPHAALATRFPRLAATTSAVPDPGGEALDGAYGLDRWALQYLLSAVREGKAAGCFVPILPSAHGWRDQARHLRRLWEAAAARYACEALPALGDGDDGRASGTGKCAGFDFEQRRQMHELIRLVLHNGEQPWRPTYRERCERMLAQVPALPRGRWALRQHVFQKIDELDD